MNRKIVSGFVAVLLVTPSLWAHHSFSTVFDLSKKTTVTGTLTKIDWRNPHIQIFLQTKDDRGQAEVWVLDGMLPSWFRLRNVNKSDFEKAIGQPVKVEGARAKDGTLYMLMQQVTFSAGNSVTASDFQFRTGAGQ